MNIDVFKLGWLFVLYGILWLIWLFGVWTDKEWAYMYGIMISILTLWYLPVGALFSIIIVAVLILFRQKLGL
jgi:hypothetical protein